ncbi:hypothetical protein BKA69DRAFT_1058296 [Paraphysoderma sedebokerense]|nr:hypothetical protein BKA69DRAFT_1058296 [Paraphysoderma sedebokerense]
MSATERLPRLSIEKNKENRGYLLSLSYGPTHYLMAVLYNQRQYVQPSTTADIVSTSSKEVLFYFLQKPFRSTWA